MAIKIKRSLKRVMFFLVSISLTIERPRPEWTGLLKTIQNGIVWSLALCEKIHKMYLDTQKGKG